VLIKWNWRVNANRSCHFRDLSNVLCLLSDFSRFGTVGLNNSNRNWALSQRGHRHPSSGITSGNRPSILTNCNLKRVGAGSAKLAPPECRTPSVRATETRRESRLGRFLGSHVNINNEKATKSYPIPRFSLQCGRSPTVCSANQVLWRSLSAPLKKVEISHRRDSTSDRLT
jgi:hypothetical protein